MLKRLALSVTLIVGMTSWCYAQEDTVSAPASDNVVQKPAGTDSAPPEEVSQEAEKKEPETRAWRLGPTIAIGFPRFQELGLEYRAANPMFSAALISGGFSLKPDDQTKVSFSNFELRGRWHPFAGSFFLGLGYGSQKINVRSNQDISSIPIEVKLDVNSNYLLPHFGWFTLTSFGLIYGFDFGVAIPSDVNSDLTSNANFAIKATAEYKELEDDAEKLGNTFGKTTLPYITLLKLGWLF